MPFGILAHSLLLHGLERRGSPAFSLAECTASPNSLLDCLMYSPLDARLDRCLTVRTMKKSLDQPLGLSLKSSDRAKHSESTSRVLFTAETPLICIMLFGTCCEMLRFPPCAEASSHATSG